MLGAMTTAADKRWKIGELARATGLTVRTLHHYDAVGLLPPSERSEAGYRLYTGVDVERLYEIVALRKLGLSLEAIGGLLLEGADPREAARLQLEQMDRQLELAGRLRARLVRILNELESRREPSIDDLIHAIKETTMIESYYTPEQLAKLEERRRQLGGEAIEQAQRDWAELIAAVSSERDRGTDPAAPRMQELARRWQELIEQFTGGDPAIGSSLQRMYREEGAVAASHGAVPDEELMTYVGAAMAALRGG
jgi:MerR family transcriptional regulator, thiopeptide resistance regulator